MDVPLATGRLARLLQYRQLRLKCICYDAQGPSEQLGRKAVNRLTLL